MGRFELQEGGIFKSGIKFYWEKPVIIVKIDEKGGVLIPKSLLEGAGVKKGRSLKVQG